MQAAAWQRRIATAVIVVLAISLTTLDLSIISLAWLVIDSWRRAALYNMYLCLITLLALEKRRYSLYSMPPFHTEQRQLINRSDSVWPVVLAVKPQEIEPISARALFYWYRDSRLTSQSYDNFLELYTPNNYTSGLNGINYNRRVFLKGHWLWSLQFLWRIYRLTSMCVKAPTHALRGEKPFDDEIRLGKFSCGHQ